MNKKKECPDWCAENPQLQKKLEKLWKESDTDDEELFLYQDEVEMLMDDFYDWFADQ